jgi:hypothetical protein
VGGWSYDPSVTNARFPVIWVNGVRNIELSMPQYPVVDMTVADNDVIFVTCMLNGWNSGMGIPEHTAYTVQPDATFARINIADGDNFVRLHRDGTDIYLVGYNGDDPCYWKGANNGASWVKTALPRRSGASHARANDLYVHPNGSVYVYGVSSTSTANYVQLEVWVNGVLIDDARKLPAVYMNPDFSWVFGPDRFCGIFAK